MISPSIQVENRLIIPRLESIRITRTLALHDQGTTLQTEWCSRNLAYLPIWAS
jgi:hypothetical protein